VAQSAIAEQGPLRGGARDWGFIFSGPNREILVPHEGFEPREVGHAFCLQPVVTLTCGPRDRPFAHE
jgi:hypothetical protein